MSPGTQSQPTPECVHLWCQHTVEYLVSGVPIISTPPPDAKYACSDHLKELIDQVLGPGLSGRPGSLHSTRGSTVTTRTATVKKVVVPGQGPAKTGRHLTI